jgi:hypothetical protein
LPKTGNRNKAALCAMGEVVSQTNGSTHWGLEDPCSPVRRGHETA